MATKEDLLKELARRRLAQMRQMNPPAGTPIQQQPNPTAAGLGQIAMNLGSAMVAEPVAGLAGMFGGAIPGMADEAAQRVEQVRSAMTPQLGPEGQALAQAGLERIPESVSGPLQRLGQRFEGIADASADLFGPVGGAAVKALPTAAAEILGAGGGVVAARGVMKLSNKARMLSNRKLFKTLEELGPTRQELRAGSNAIYTALDESGIRIPPAEIKALLTKAEKFARETGGPGFENRSIAHLRKLAEEGQPEQLSQMMIGRDIAQNSINQVSPHVTDTGLRDMFDDFINDLSVDRLTGPGREKAGKQIKMARELYRRSVRSRKVEEAIAAGREAASGAENGIRNEMRKLLKPKEAKFFTADELDAIRAVVKGGPGVNWAKRLGKFGFGEGGATSTVGFGIGQALGLKLGGPTGMVAMAGIGFVSRKLATQMTTRNANLANQIIKAGNNGREITQAYLRHVPPASRNGRDLASLLVRPDVKLQGIPQDAFTVEAVNRAKSARAQFQRSLARSAAGVGAIGAGSAASRATAEQ